MPATVETSTDPRKPIYLLADSQLLFWKTGEALFLSSMLAYLRGPATKAAYLGASNGDRPEFYALFVAAMAQIGIRACRHVRAALPPAEAAFLAEAELILLAGGDTGLGLQALQDNGADEIIMRRYQAGCLLMGISAGAIQLGRSVIVERDPDCEVRPGLGLVPWVMDAHQEASGWRNLRRVVADLPSPSKGLGIPTGGGVLFHPDGMLTPVRTHAHELTLSNGELQHRELLPAINPDADTRR